MLPGLLVIIVVLTLSCQNYILETSTDDITESEEGSDYETDTSEEEQE